MQNKISILLLLTTLLLFSCNKKEEINNDIYKANVGGVEVSFKGQLSAARYLDIRDGVPVACNYVIHNTGSPVLYISVVDSLTSSKNYSYPNISVTYSVMENGTVVNYHQDHSDEGYFNIYSEGKRIIANFYLTLSRRNSSDALIIKNGKIDLPIQYMNRKWNTHE